MQIQLPQSEARYWEERNRPLQELSNKLKQQLRDLPVIADKMRREARPTKEEMITNLLEMAKSSMENAIGRATDPLPHELPRFNYENGGNVLGAPQELMEKMMLQNKQRAENPFEFLNLLSLISNESRRPMAHDSIDSLSRKYKESPEFQRQGLQLQRLMHEEQDPRYIPAVVGGEEEGLG